MKRVECSHVSVPMRVNHVRVALSKTRSEGVFCARPMPLSPSSRSAGFPSRRRSTAAWPITRIFGGALLSDARVDAWSLTTCMFCMTVARFTVNATPKSIFCSSADAADASELLASCEFCTSMLETSIKPAARSLSRSAVKNSAPYIAGIPVISTLNAARAVARVPEIVSNCGV